jgi:hypothetical protein
MGGPEVRQGQLRNLLRASELQGTEVQIMPTERDDHPGLEGAFTLLMPKGRAQVAYFESHGHARLVTDTEEVRLLAARYGSIRAQALGFGESRELIEKLLGDL